jgi:hypothetical protein
MVKASVIYDTSSPYGTDMPLPGFMSASGTSFDPGPTRSPEFHTKARFARVGTNFEWPDIAGSNTAITGKLEFDFEGNFTRGLNRNISTIRSSMASIRLAYGRVDHKINDDTNIFGVFGQDWTPFGSSTLPNLFETTGMGLGFGTLYERAPQFRFGVGHKLGGSRNVFVQSEFAAVMPAYGNDPSNVADQLGYGEKQGADSGRPELQARLVLQWQLDKAPGVVPAQLIFSGVQGNRKVMVRASDVPLCTNGDILVCPDAKVFQKVFPSGAETTSNRAGWTAELASDPLRHSDHQVLERVRLALVFRGQSGLEFQRHGGVVEGLRERCRHFARGLLMMERRPCSSESTAAGIRCLRRSGQSAPLARL